MEKKAYKKEFFNIIRIYSFYYKRNYCDYITKK